MNKTPELVIFDCDGVLVDSEIIFCDVLRSDLHEHGLVLNSQQTMDLFLGGSMETVQTAVLDRGVALPNNWIEQVYAKVTDRLKAGVDAVEGVHELLSVLNQSNLPFCVASNGPVHKMQITLGQNDLLDHFDNAMFSAYEIGSWKPDPTLFLHAAKHFSIAPERCLVIEDSETGITAAQRAGMPVLAYAPYDGMHEKLVAMGVTCFDHMNQVPALLGLNNP